MTDTVRVVSTSRKVFAAMFDFLTIFVLGGYVIGKLTGATTEGGFNLQGLPALVLFGVIGAYFYVGRKYGGTIWQRILNAQ